MRKKISLHKDEIVILKSRSSVWFLILRILRLIIFLILPMAMIFGVVFMVYREGFWFIMATSVIAIFLLVFWYQYSLWKDPVFILTNKRVVFEHDKSLWSSHIVEINFKNISDVALNKSSLFESMLGFGSIVITPVSGSGKFEIKYMPDARSIVNKLMEVHDQDPLSLGTIEDFFEHTQNIIDFFQLGNHEKKIITDMESENNRGALAVLRKEKVFCVLRKGKINFPSSTICSLPSLRVHNLIAKKFGSEVGEEDILLVGS